MFIEERIFTRAVTAGCSILGRDGPIRSFPSTRNRIRNTRSSGSMWMSVAPSCTAGQEDLVDEPDDGRARREVRFGETAGLHLPDRLLDDLLDGDAAGVILVDRGKDAALGGRDDVHHIPGDPLDLVDRQDVEDVRQGDRQFRRFEEDRDQLVAAREAFGDAFQRRGLDQVVVELDEVDAGLGGEDRGDLLLGDEAQVDQDLPDPLPGALLLAQGEVQLVGGDEPRLDQPLAEHLPAGRRLRVPCRGRHRVTRRRRLKKKPKAGPSAFFAARLRSLPYTEPDVVASRHGRGRRWRWMVSITPFGPAERTQTGVGGVVADVKFAALMTYGLPHGSTGNVVA